MGWIKCSERLPEETGSYLVAMRHGSSFQIESITVGRYWKRKQGENQLPFESGWVDAEILSVIDTERIRRLSFLTNEEGVITHWMPLPQPPEED